MLRRLLSLFGAGKAPAPTSRAASASAPSGLVPGQVWTIKSPVPTPAKVVIGRLEEWHGRPIVHVSIVDIPISGGRTTTIGHAPFDQAALVSSLGSLIVGGRGEADDFEDSIAGWRRAEGGVWTVSVADVIASVIGPPAR